MKRKEEKTMAVVAVVGCGRIANIAHLPALSKIEDARIKYACDLIKEKAEKAKEDFPKIENVITDYKVALEDPEVEVVYVLTPNYAHYTVTMDALKAGKHVFCEKPITVSYKLSCEMAEEAEKQGKLLNIGVCNRYHKYVEVLEQWNREGKFGNIYHVYCSFRAFRSIPGLGGAFTDRKQSGGGVLIDWGIHYLDLILYILGGVEIKEVMCNEYCEMAKDMKSYKYTGMWAEDTKDLENGVNDVDDFITGFVRTNKASISFNGAWAQNINKADTFVDFCGDKAGADFNGPDESLQFNYVKYGRQVIETPNFDAGGVAFYEGDRHPDPKDVECRLWYNAVLNDTEVMTKPEQALVVTQILEAIYESAKTGAPVYLNND